MRNFSMRFYKNLVWIYICILVCFSYTVFMGEIPNHIYLSEGEEIEYHFSIPISVTEEYGKNTISEVSAGRTAAASDYTVTCRLFGIFPVKEVEVSVIPSQHVYASGRIIGIYGSTSGVLVLGTSPVEAANGLNYEPAENKVFSGDYILAVNHQEIKTKEELVELVNKNGNEQLVLTMNRKGEYIDVAVTPVPVADNQYMLGIWVKDDMAGIGTMTYYRSDRSFGALGHGIGDGETGELLSMSEGSVYQAKLLGITKGERGTPGELEGLIYYGGNNCLGSISKNDNLGIYGMLEEDDYMEYLAEDTSYEVGYKQEIQKGKACILSNISGTIESYEISIESVDYMAENSNKGIRFCVTDETLLAETGGIVQGMSGSPIIQNGKLIGAVTHVLVSDPAKGYGIFAETMLGRQG